MKLVCLLFVILFVGWLVVLSQANDISAINALPKWITLFSLLGVVCAVGTIFVVIYAFRSLGTSGRWVWAKLCDFAVALACLCLVWFLFSMNLMNFNTNF